MKQRFNIEINLVSSGKICLFNEYLPEKWHEPRKNREISEIYSEIETDNPIPESRNYLALELAGEAIGEGADFSIPTVKYYFRWKLL